MLPYAAIDSLITPATDIRQPALVIFARLPLLLFAFSLSSITPLSIAIISAAEMPPFSLIFRFASFRFRHDISPLAFDAAIIDSPDMPADAIIIFSLLIIYFADIAAIIITPFHYFSRHFAIIDFHYAIFITPLRHFIDAAIAILLDISFSFRH